MTDHSLAAELISAGFLVAVLIVLMAVGRRVAVAANDTTYTPAGGVARTVQKGSIIPAADVSLVLSEDYRSVRRPLLRALVVGADNRTSTSKVVALAWTFAITFGIVALIVAKWLGSPTGYDILIHKGLQGEYLLFLGGPYAAAVLAKYTASSTAQGQANKSVAPIGSATPSQLIANDDGDGDLGDFQYVLFNAVTIAWFLGTFVPHLSDGMPDVPALLAGLTLTSAAGYSAKKLLTQAAPVMTALQPPSAPPSTMSAKSTVELWGRNLIVPASDGTALAAVVSVGGQAATVSSFSQPLGVDQLVVEVPSGVAPGPVKVTATRADGVAATGPNGTDGLTLTVTAPPSA